MKIRYILAALAALQLVPSSYSHAEGWFKKENLLMRGRIIASVPEEDSHTSINGEVTADDSATPEIDFTYFWTKNIGTELILAVVPHELGIDASANGNLDLGRVKLIPPTLLMQYHFTPDQNIRPYVGAGLNYTFFMDVNPGKSVTRVQYEDNIGYALQAGVDFALNDKWSFNLDAKKLFLNTDVKINSGAIHAEVSLDPWLFGAGFGYRF